MPGRREQLWVQDLGQRHFRLQSIPFFVYGIGPGDEFVLDEAGHVVECDRHGQKHVVRVAFDRDVANDVHEPLHGQLGDLDLAHEWHGSGYVAMSLDQRALPEPLRDVIAPHLSAGTAFTEVATDRPAS
ncbi:DUF4265 domain-containing protein [Salsipaludibacter albus]|uniref:DUF4265 domain-containing protein n=1 Tax=Salsipaludibacter albus TaxID=2849650 RepID=UPI001EE3FA00|nr:DUF4265 domain-containing protein [Salsipaludibacter albus]MBY5162878.1 DUF4265 domain-containing protein [Salsipaludibacter albus]